MIKRMFQRMLESLRPIKQNENGACSTITDNLSSLYEDFLSRLGQYFISCLFEGATSSRQAIALEGLAMLFITFVNKEDSINMGLNILGRTKRNPRKLQSECFVVAAIRCRCFAAKKVAEIVAEKR